MERLKEQLKTEYKEDAEKVLVICDKLKELDNGHLWESQFNLLVETIYPYKYPDNRRRYKLTKIGELVYSGIMAEKNKA